MQNYILYTYLHLYISYFPSFHDISSILPFYIECIRNLPTSLKPAADGDSFSRNSLLCEASWNVRREQSVPWTNDSVVNKPLHTLHELRVFLLHEPVSRVFGESPVAALRGAIRAIKTKKLIAYERENSVNVTNWQ